MSEDNLLGGYLRARRALVRPGRVGLPDHGVRRVNGLRREEVAMLAGISADYYLRLEQGRDHNPSIQSSRPSPVSSSSIRPRPTTSSAWLPRSPGSGAGAPSARSCRTVCGSCSTS